MASAAWAALLPAPSRLKVEVAIAFVTTPSTRPSELPRTRSMGRGEGVWRYDFRQVQALWADGGVTAARARGGTWEGVGRAVGRDFRDDGDKIDWSYAFSKTFALDLPAMNLTGKEGKAIANLTLSLFRDARGRTLYKFEARGNGTNASGTNDIFDIEKRVTLPNGASDVQIMRSNMPPTIVVGSVPGPKVSTSAHYLPRTALAGVVRWPRPQIAQGRRLQGRASFKQKVAETTYDVKISWSGG